MGKLTHAWLLVPVPVDWPPSVHSSLFGDPARGQGFCSLCPSPPTPTPLPLPSSFQFGFLGRSVRAVWALDSRGRWWPAGWNGMEDGGGQQGILNGGETLMQCLA